MRRAAYLVVIAGCGASAPVPAVRFANAPPVTVINDRVHVPRKPAETEYDRLLDNFDGSFHRLLTHELELERPARARGVNALDEVPDSTWFTNRIGVRAVSPDEVADPPGGVGTPEPHKPWTIVGAKNGGVSVGFMIEDTRGEKFLLKFDPRGFRESESAAQIIVGRLLWALGYNVTEDHVVHLTRDDLVLARDAERDSGGDAMALDERELDDMLARVDIAPDGTMRALASRYLDGEPLGGHPGEGVRADDPNDRIPHELRRDLRGTAAIFAWLDHTDLHFGNSVDMWVHDPADLEHRYVKHYFIDFGISLGVGALKNHNHRYGYEYQVDWRAITRSLVSLGILERPWETRTRPPYRGIGHYEVELYDPGSWKPLTPMYAPVRLADRFDKFWGAKLIMKLTRAHVRAAVDAAKLSDPRAAAWLVDALVARQRKTARYWFQRVNPLDAAAIAGDRLCFTDLSIEYGFAPAKNTRYTLTFFDRNGGRIGATTLDAARSGRTCGLLELSAGHESYTIVRVDTVRPRFQGTTYVYVAREPFTLAPRVIGIWRS